MDYPHRGLGYRDFSNIRLDKMLPFCLKWKPLEPTESLRSHFEENSPRLSPVFAWEWACGRPLPGTRLATEPSLPQPLGHRSAEKGCFLYSDLALLRSHHPLRLVLGNQLFKMSSDSDSGGCLLLRSPWTASWPPTGLPPLPPHQQPLGALHWEWG